MKSRNSTLLEELKDFVRWLCGWLVLGWLVAAGVNHCTPIAKDDSDPANGRSGMSVYIDHATGCEYLSARHDGGITPRLNANGTHRGCRP